MNDKTNHLKACAGIAAIVGVASLAIVTLIALFAPAQISTAAWMVGSLCLMGTALGYLATNRS